MSEIIRDTTMGKIERASLEARLVGTARERNEVIQTAQELEENLRQMSTLLQVTSKDLQRVAPAERRVDEFMQKATVTERLTSVMREAAKKEEDGKIKAIQRAEIAEEDKRVRPVM